jgi:hypothetical protein
MAGRWVAGLVAARLATASLAGALLLLRGAILRTGIGALIVGAGELIYRFGELVQGAGGFGNALALMGDVAKAVWAGIKASASSFVDSFRALGADVEAIWLRLMAFLSRKWAEFLGEIGPTFNAVSERIGAGVRRLVRGRGPGLDARSCRGNAVPWPAATGSARPTRSRAPSTASGRRSMPARGHGRAAGRPTPPRSTMPRRPRPA